MGKKYSKQNIKELIEKILYLLDECPHSVDEATLFDTYGMTPENIEKIRELQEVWSYSIGYKRVKDIKNLIQKINTNNL